MSGSIKKILFVVIFALLLLPGVNDQLGIITSHGLEGYFTRSEDVAISVEKWWDGSFQDQKTKYLNDNISFRPDLIRLNAQVNYSLFDLNVTGWGVFGKNECLLDIVYIKSWSGADYIGYDSIRSRLTKLKALQDTFASMGKSLILVHAANKAYYYADCIPDKYIPAVKGPTNYETYVRLGDSLNICQLDFNRWFCNMRDTSRELLYTRQGIHWSVYGGMLAADSIVGYIEELRHIQMPHMVLKSVVHTDQPRGTDNDISKTLNLILPFTNETFTYGTYTCESAGDSVIRPSAIYIGDSFISGLIEGGMCNCAHSQWDFWFYMKERHQGDSYSPAYPMDGYDWLAAIEKTDCVILLYTANNLPRLGDGFIEKAYEHYYPDASRVQP